jgi:hypothetical protein
MRVIFVFRYDQLWFPGLALTIGSMIFAFKNLDSPLKFPPIGDASRNVQPEVFVSKTVFHSAWVRAILFG